MDEKRLNSLLSYIGEGADEQDLYAAGYTKQELEEAGWFTPSQPDPNYQTTDTLTAYTPTKRENFQSNLQTIGEDLGLPKGEAYRISSNLAGTNPNNPIGAADLTPLGVIFGAEEGGKQFKEGWEAGDKGQMAAGAANTALSVAEALPGGKAISKGLQEAGKALAKSYDPTVVRMFFGPNSPKADKAALAEAEKMVYQGNYSDEEIWMRTGWWNSPNGWRFEISDDKMEINPQLIRAWENQSKGLTVTGNTTQVVNHPEFWDALNSKSHFSSQIGPNDLKLSKKDVNSGLFNPNTGDIEVEALSEEDLKKTLLHELQHLEQTADGSVLGVGSNPEGVQIALDKTLSQLPRDALEYLLDSKLFHKQYKNLELRQQVLNQKSPKGWGIAGEDDLWGDTPDVLAEDWDRFFKKITEEREVYKGLLSEEFLDALDQFSELTDYYSGGMRQGTYNYFPAIASDKQTELRELSFDLYERDIGEAEARATANRKNLTPEQRSFRHPKNDYDKNLSTLFDHYDFKKVLNNLLIENENWANTRKKKPWK